MHMVLIAGWLTLFPSTELPAEFEQILRRYEAAYRRGDGEALSALFAEDGFVLPSDHLPVRGRAEVREYYKGPGGALVLRAFAFGMDGSVGYIIGGFSRREGEADVGKFVLTLKRDKDGRWLIFSDMDNGNRRR